MADMPFRWTVARREQLGSLVEGRSRHIPADYLAELRRSAARLIALSGGADPVFVGRSPESHYDYLSGMFEGVAEAPEPVLFQYSGRGIDVADVDPVALRTLTAYLATLSIDPSGIMSRRRGVVFCDLVARGSTFDGIVGLLERLCRETGTDWPVLQRRIAFLGMTARTKNSPNAWRWTQHRPWADDAPHIRVASVSVEWWFWDELGNAEAKTTRSHHARRWADPAGPGRGERNLNALARALALHERARTTEERVLFTAELTSQDNMSERWLRALIGALRR